MAYVPYSSVRSSTLVVRPTRAPLPSSVSISSAFAVTFALTWASTPTAVCRLVPVVALAPPTCCRKSSW